jgi:hypothetical protein
MRIRSGTNDGTRASDSSAKPAKRGSDRSKKKEEKNLTVFIPQ